MPPHWGPGLAAATSLFMPSLTTKRDNTVIAASQLLLSQNSSLLDSLASSPTLFWSIGAVEAALTGEKSHGAWGKVQGGNWFHPSFNLYPLAGVFWLKNLNPQTSFSNQSPEVFKAAQISSTLSEGHHSLSAKGSINLTHFGACKTGFDEIAKTWFNFVMYYFVMYRYF